MSSAVHCCKNRAEVRKEQRKGGREGWWEGGRKGGRREERIGKRRRAKIFEKNECIEGSWRRRRRKGRVEREI